MTKRETILLFSLTILFVLPLFILTGNYLKQVFAFMYSISFIPGYLALIINLILLIGSLYIYSTLCAYIHTYIVNKYPNIFGVLL